MNQNFLGGINLIDLIIPYYNNPEGLARTLESINNDVFYITIVDDSSSIYMPYDIKADQVFRYNANHGPGFARQFGLDRTHKAYVMFIDAGDIFLSKEIQYTILETIEDDLYTTDVFSFPYYHKDTLTTIKDNRMHGKVYKREFIYKNKITFCENSSYLNEDIGFNRTCKLLTNVNFINVPVIKQIEEENSLSNKDNCVALYRDQNRALSLVSIHTIDICRKNNIDTEIEINQIAIALYYWFIKCAAERPEYLQDAWSGAKIFYDHFKNDIKSQNLWIGSTALKKCLQYKNKIHFPINVLRFVHDIQLNENIPNNYLT